MPSGGAAKLKSVLFDITEPILSPFRNIIPRIGLIDISPIVAIIALDIVKTILLYFLGYPV
jgi:YggT family protein